MWEHQQGRCYYAHLGTFHANSTTHLIFLQYLPLTWMSTKKVLLSSDFNCDSQCIKESLCLSDTVSLQQSGMEARSSL